MAFSYTFISFLERSSVYLLSIVNCHAEKCLVCLGKEVF